jgi:2-haloacid dehalogenase
VYDLPSGHTLTIPYQTRNGTTNSESRAAVARVEDVRQPGAMTEQHFDAVVFDAYGTLLDVHAAMARHAKRLGSDWQALATEWRIKQLEYSSIDNMTMRRARRDFAACAADALDYVLARHAIDSGLRTELLTGYECLDAYAEVPTMLATLRRHGFRLAILSNGTPTMLMAACQAAGITSLLDAILSVEQAGCFKPAPAVYGLVQTELGVTRSSGSSSPGWSCPRRVRR